MIIRALAVLKLKILCTTIVHGAKDLKEHKTCPNCQTTFIQENLSDYHWDRKKYCSRRCKSNHASEECVCIFCSTIFFVRERSLNQGRGQFCSRKCAGLWGGLKNTIQNTSIVECKNCQKSFNKPNSHINKSKELTHNHYCSKSCEIDYRTAINCFCSVCRKPLHKNLARLNAVKENHYCSEACKGKGMLTTIDVNCTRCGITISRRPSEINKENYCSRKCLHPFAEWVEIPCETCEKDIRRLKSGLKGNNFCSRGCAQKSKRFGYGVQTQGLDGETYCSMIEALFSDFLFTHNITYQTQVEVSKNRFWTCDFFLPAKENRMHTDIWIEVDGMGESRRGDELYVQNNQVIHEKLKYMEGNNMPIAIIQTGTFTKDCELIADLVNANFDNSFLQANKIRDLDSIWYK